MGFEDDDVRAFLAQLRTHVAEGDDEVTDEERKAVGDLVEDIVPFVLDQEDAVPSWDLVPLGRPVAELVPVTDLEGETAVVVDRQLLVVAHRVAAAFATALPAHVDGDRLHLEVDVAAPEETSDDDEDEDGSPPPAWALALTPDHPAVETYVGAMLALQQWEALPEAEPAIDPLREPIVVTVQQVIAWFEIAMPFAHVASGHDSNEGTERLPWIEGDFTADRFAWDEEQDEEATVRAIYAVINRGKQVFGDLRMVVWALDAWLATRMLIAGAPLVVKGLSQDVFERHVDRHADRRALLRALLEQDDELRSSLVVASALEPIMAQFWEHTIQALIGGGPEITM
jgi:hypothetical protein